MFGGLFAYENDKKLEEFIDMVNKKDALKIVEAGIDYSQQNGLYTLEESHILYKMLNKLKEE